MYATCPKCGHQQGAGSALDADVCAACGLIFSKYVKARFAAPRSAARAVVMDDETTLAARARELFLHVPDRVEALHVYARAALLAVIIVYGFRLARMDVPSWEMAGSLMHPPMVPIHEFGHLLFMPFGEFMHLLGGSLFQVGLPLIFGGIFIVKNRDPFAAAVMLWWFAVAVMDVAPYMYDAQEPRHVLLTGRTGENGAHDFIDVLGDLSLLTRAQSVGYSVHHFGVVILGVSLVWAAVVVWKQFQRRGR
jgi:hypothetical protein